MKIQSKLFALLFYFLCNLNAHAQFSSQGEEFLISTCSKELFYKQSLENIRRYQTIEKEAFAITKNKSVAAQFVKEIINKDEDELFLHRQKRNTEIDSQDDKLRYLITKVQFDIVRTSMLKVFMEYRTGGDDVRLKRRLHETCLDLVNEMINSKHK